MSGQSSEYVTGITVTGGHLRFKGYGTFVFVATPLPLPVMPLFLGGGTQQAPNPNTLVRAYDQEAAVNGWWQAANSAYIPIGTATNYKVLIQQKKNPRYGLIISRPSS